MWNPEQETINLAQGLTKEVISSRYVEFYQAKMRVRRTSQMKE
jgi:hypothetical protein